MRTNLAGLLVIALSAATWGEVPDIESFRPVPQFPAPAPGASLTVGTTNSGTGQIVLWNGDAVYQQERINGLLGPLFEEKATGYVGNPTFVALNSGNRTAYLGDGAAGIIYEIPDILNPPDSPDDTDFDPVTFFSGTLLDNTFIIVDRVRDDTLGAEIFAVHIERAKVDDPRQRFPVLQKPLGSSPANIFVDRNRGRTWIMDATTGELRWFVTSDLSNAYFTETPLDWEADGTPVGTPGQFLLGGVYGVNPANEIILGGDTGVAGTGGIQYVSQTEPVSVIDTLDPAGTGPPYELVYSRVVDEVLAVDPTVTPPVAYASTDFVPAIPPDSPCEDFDEIDLEFAAFLETFAAGTDDLDGDTIRDTAMLELVELYSCQGNAVSALAFSTNEAYDNNRATFLAEANAAALAPYERIIPVLLFMNQAMRTSVQNILAFVGTPLTGTYVTVTCEDPENCDPEFVEDPFVARRIARGVTEPYFATGNPDDDDFTNLEEYNNNEAKGGDDFDFAIAAASDRLDGSEGRSGGGSGGGCFIATAAYGTPVAAELDGLRAMRDRHLLTSGAGSAFVDAYYRLSPPIAAWTADRPLARAVVRLMLLPFARGAGALWGVGLLTMCAAVAVASSRVRKPVAVSRK